MFTKYELTIPKKNPDEYTRMLSCKYCKSPSRILQSNITIKNPLYTNDIKNGNRNNIRKFILSDDFTNNHCTDNKNDCILPCNDDQKCITKNIFNIMILCCNLTYSLINQTRVNIFDYFYTTNLIEELCIVYTLLNKYTYNEIAKKIEEIIKQYYSIMFKLIYNHADDKTDNPLNNEVSRKLFFLNTSLKKFIKSNENDDLINFIENKNPNRILIKFLKENQLNSENLVNFLTRNYILNNNDDIDIINLINNLYVLKKLLLFYSNDENNFIKDIYLKIQQVTVDHYINYFEEAYKIIKNLLENDFNTFYKNIYKYDYNNIDVINLIKLRTYLLLMFTYKIRFISLNDVDDKGGRQAEFFISNVLRDFYNYYYIDNKLNNIDPYNIKIKYKEILKNILQYNYLYTEIFEDIYIYENTYMNIYANNNIITLEYYTKNKNIIELFRPFEKMYNINECSYNNVKNKNDGKIGGDLIYLHQQSYFYNNNILDKSINSNSICIIVDSKAYQDITFNTKNKIDKTIIQCYLYAQYVKECYKNNIYTDTNNKINLYLSVVNPIYGSYYVYDYNYVNYIIYKDNDLIKNLQKYKLFNKKEEKRRERKEKKEKEEKKVRTLK